MAIEDKDDEAEWCYQCARSRRVMPNGNFSNHDNKKLLGGFWVNARLRWHVSMCEGYIEFNKEEEGEKKRLVTCFLST